MIKKTGGGKFDPTKRGIYFAASLEMNLLDVDYNPNLLVAINILKSKQALKNLDYALEKGNIFIDSGVFSLTNAHRKKHNTSIEEALALAPEEIDGFDKLFEDYVRIVQDVEDRTWGYIELDLGGRDNKIRTRAKLEAMGLRPIPVYHPLNDGWDYFDELAQTYDRICFGNVAQIRGEDRKKLIATAWERHRKYPELWIHLLGYQPDEILNAFPADSVDASSWSAGTRWGRIPEKANGKRLGEIEQEFVYRRGDKESWERSFDMLITIAYSNGLNWRNHLEEAEKHGISRYR